MPLEALVLRGGAKAPIFGFAMRPEAEASGYSTVIRLVAFAEAFVAAGVGVAEDAGEEADGGVEEDGRGEFAAGEDVVADGELFVAEELRDALVDAFVAAAEEDDAVERGEAAGGGLGEALALGGEQDDGLFVAGVARVALGVRARDSRASWMGWGFRTMPSPPPKGRSSTVR